MAAKLKVLFLITDIGKGGAERFLIDLCTELQRRGDVEFIIGSLFENNQYQEFTKTFPIVYLNYPLFSFLGKNECPEYKKLLNDFQPDVIHTNRFLAEFLSSFYVSYHIKYVCHGHDNMIQLDNFSLDKLGNKEKLLNFFEKQYLINKKYKKAATYFIANSSHTLAYYQRVLPNFMHQYIKLIEYGFNYTRFYKEKTNYWKEGEKIKLVNVGSFQAKKNQQLIIKIGEELRAMGLDFEINLLGDGGTRESIQAAVDASGLSDRILLHGNVDNVEEWLWDSHVYLHTAWYEPFGLVFLEAMAAGLPCVTLDGKGNRNLIEEGENGYMLFEEDAKAFAQRIDTLFKDQETYKRISTYSQVFSEKYDIKKSTDRFVDFYKSAN